MEGGEPNWENRTLFHGDNLDFLRAMNSGSVDLIATDPPFNKNKDFHAQPDRLAKDASFEDRWFWDKDIHEEWLSKLNKEEHVQVRAAVFAAKDIHSDGMGAFVCYMAVRLIAMHRILKPSGSLFLHCDATASHYLKLCLDAIFGKNNFRNEIIWDYGKASNANAKKFLRGHETLLFYVKDRGKAYFKPTYDKGLSERKKQLIKAGYNTKNQDGLRYIYIYDEKIVRRKQIDLSKYDKIVHVDTSHGNRHTDVMSVKFLNPKADENTGYPTQKPLDLYRRIIKAACPKDGIVCDPFAGCATTCVAAELLHRNWVGIDLWPAAGSVVLKRARQEKLPLLEQNVIFTAELPKRTDAADEDEAVLGKVRRRTKTAYRKHKPKLIKKFGNQCQGCDRTFDDHVYLQVDHIVPRSHKGTDKIDNLTLLCGPCNIKKSDRHLLAGLRELNKRDGFMAHQQSSQ